MIKTLVQGAIMYKIPFLDVAKILFSNFLMRDGISLFHNHIGFYIAMLLSYNQFRPMKDLLLNSRVGHRNLLT